MYMPNGIHGVLVSMRAGLVREKKP
jgi:hypothetical protein